MNLQFRPANMTAQTLLVFENWSFYGFSVFFSKNVDLKKSSRSWNSQPYGEVISMNTQNGKFCLKNYCSNLCDFISYIVMHKKFHMAHV